jgi:hypothetical protein
MRTLAFTLLVACPTILAQRTSDYDDSVVSQVRIDLRDLGYPPRDVIPPDESAIRSLAVAPSGTVYGATSGHRSHLFVLYPQHGYVQPLGYLKGVTTVHRSVVVAANGDVYIGASNGVDNNGQGYSGYAGGSLLRFRPRPADEEKPIRIEAECTVEDLGIPVAGDGIYTLAIDRERNVIYGLTYPTGRFFSYSIANGKFAVHGGVAERSIPGEKFEKDRNIGRALAVDRDGKAYGSGDRGVIFRFNPETGKLEWLRLTAPTVPGREPYNRVDCWAGGSKEFLYGGTSDGYLFRLDPKSLELENLGKPLNQYRMRGLAIARNGKLYGVGGSDDEMARLFSYDPAHSAYQILGMVDVNHRPYYSWQAYVIDAVAIGLDGTLYLGQSERKSKLYLYYPE